MSTINVLDSVGTTQTIAKVPATHDNSALSNAALPVAIALDDGVIGSTNSTAPASDTAVSGLNGRLQRIAQNLTTMNTTLGATNPQLPATPSGAVTLNITRPANVTAYAANDVVGGAFTISTGLSIGQRGMLTSADVLPQIAAIPSGMANMRVYLYNITPPSALADNAAWDLPSGDRASFLGYVDLGTPVDLGSSCFIQADGINKQFQLGGSANLFGYLVTIGGFTPANNSEVYQLRMQFLGL